MKALEHRFGYGLTIFVLITCVAGAIGSLQFQTVSRWFPLFAGTAGAVLALVVLLVDITGDLRHRGDEGASAGVPTESTNDDVGPKSEDDQAAAAVVSGFAGNLAWLAAFVVLLVLFSMPIAVLVWIVLLIRFCAKESWIRASVSGMAMTVLLIVFCAFLALGLPEGRLLDSSLIIPTWRL